MIQDKENSFDIGNQHRYCKGIISSTVIVVYILEHRKIQCCTLVVYLKKN